jgi:hypothetical protein
MKQSLPPASLLLLFLCFSSVFAFIPHRTLLLDNNNNNLSDESRFLSNKEIWFNQTLDHFSPYVLYFHNPLFQLNFNFHFHATSCYLFF